MLAVCVVAATTSTACAPPPEPVGEGQAAADRGAPEPAEAESTAAAEAGSGSEATAYGDGPGSGAPSSEAWTAADEAWVTWNRTGQSQEGWARLFEDAVRAGDRMRTGRLLDALGRRLSVWRGAGLDDATITAVQRFASAEAGALRRRVDPRRVLPALEVLMDTGDAAALLRVTGEREGRAAGLAWTAARQVGEARSVHEGDVRFAGGCELEWDGEPRGADAASFRATIGSHGARCAGGPTTIVPVQAARPLSLDVVDGVLTWNLAPAP